MWFKNTNKDKNVYLLLDRSGSMATEWPATLSSINTYVKKLEDDVNVYIAAFDSNGYTSDGNLYGSCLDFKILRQTSAKSFEPVTEYEVSPRGGTPLFDAAGRIINQMLMDNPEKAVLVIMTDGEENTSREFNRNAVIALLNKLEKKDWPVIYLGAGFKEVEQYATSTFNISLSNTFNTTGATRSMAMGSLGIKSMNYFNSAVGESGATMSYSAEEKAYYGGEDPDTKTTDKV